ncbi:protocatechuate 3,4-dioxygenase alpha subunit [Roseibium hamelinense]|uniref:Protocatechuate 3,4-dioxygenase alpha subunit n=1 Tax=Roseibium hamelinense TaxID=150831 RepID=A0A562T8U2_9HYPH|nr:protocatechuate 3,4-dioxygenase subunit alpha [Roseibium hamelinense]MTI43503.1 protocatechuate 3,4-dioxygenase subunit alpha [Roseibium hamelinense]TWI89704.1 protocatechuate 3,4-dioxygenase alpha subunit [Roseibium hamelinense]
MVPTLGYLKETPSQTAGPYVHIGLAPAQAGQAFAGKTISNKLAGPDTPGERITIEGRVFDGTGTPIRDALIECWQADANGRYNCHEDLPGGADHDGFAGFGRCGSDFETGLFSFETIKPGVVPGRNGVQQAPHISLWIVARGLNVGLQTRLYFSEETAANAADPVLNTIEQEARRQTLIAERISTGDVAVYRFNIHLQGAEETVFFDI